MELNLSYFETSIIHFHFSLKICLLANFRLYVVHFWWPINGVMANNLDLILQTHSLKWGARGRQKAQEEAIRHPYQLLPKSSPVTEYLGWRLGWSTQLSREKKSTFCYITSPNTNPEMLIYSHRAQEEDVMRDDHSRKTPRPLINWRTSTKGE